MEKTRTKRVLLALMLLCGGGCAISSQFVTPAPRVDAPVQRTN